jgi:hypothetical protein
MEQAEAVFRQALELNPEHPVAHNQLAQLEAEAGRAPDGMERLLSRSRAGSVDAETFTALVHVLRYCGLLDESAAADAIAKEADPGIRTSIGHTWFMMCEYERVVRDVPLEDRQGLREMALATLGRTAEALALTRKMPTDHPSWWFFHSWQAFLEGKRIDSIESGKKAVALFPDPEGLYYVARQWVMMDLRDAGLELLDMVVTAKGYACPETLDRDPALEPVRSDPRFRTIRDRAAAARDDALARFRAGGGPEILGLT